MRSPSIASGDYLLVHPEDVGTSVGSCVYALVVSEARATVKVQTFGLHAETFRLKRAVALKRMVSQSEATGSAPGMWLRKAVCFSYRSHLYYGQVVGYSGSRLVISTYLGERTIDLQNVQGDVFPVVAMALWTHRWAKSSYSFEELDPIHQRMVDRPVSSQEATPPSIESWLAEVPSGVEAPSDRQLAWMDPATGVTKPLSLMSVVNFVFYIDGDHQVPRELIGTIGTSFYDQPSQVTSAVPLRQLRSAQGNPQRATAGAPAAESAFFDPLIDDDEEDDDEDEHPDRGPSVRPVQTFASYAPDGPQEGFDRQFALDSRQREPTRHPVREQQQPAQPAVAPVSQSPGSEDVADIELIELIRTHKPHLLRYYLTEESSGPAQASNKRARRPGTEESTPSAKKGRIGFTPTPEQDRVHLVVTAPEHRGKNSDEFVEFLLSASTAQFYGHPGLLARVYDLQFGSRGLSIMHFQRVGFIEKLQSMAPGAVNMSDYSVQPPRPIVPAAWSDLCAATRSFEEYCRVSCDRITWSVATALSHLVTELEGWKQWEVTDLPLLVLWIDATLEKYRNAVVHDLHDGTTTRADAVKWFSAVNPELHSLLFSAMGRRISEQSARTSYAQPGEATPRHSNAPNRKIPADVVASLPTQHGKEVCLHFLSRRGCNSSDPARCTFKNRAHFWPQDVPENLRQYIQTRLGGLNKRFSDA